MIRRQKAVFVMILGRDNLIWGEDYSFLHLDGREGEPVRLLELFEDQLVFLVWKTLRETGVTFLEDAPYG